MGTVSVTTETLTIAATLTATCARAARLNPSAPLPRVIHLHHHPHLLHHPHLQLCQLTPPRIASVRAAKGTIARHPSSPVTTRTLTVSATHQAAVPSFLRLAPPLERAEAFLLLTPQRHRHRRLLRRYHFPLEQSFTNLPLRVEVAAQT
jgi:hypothetical protein